MGLFSLRTKKSIKNRRQAGESGDLKHNIDTDSRSRLSIDTTPVFKPVLSTPPSSPTALQPFNPPFFNGNCSSSIIPPLTPPPTPTTPKHEQIIRPRSASVPEFEIHPSKTNVKPRSSSFISAAFSKSGKLQLRSLRSNSTSFSCTLFQTPAQRKRREKREGKLPAILSDYETPETSDTELTTETNSSYASLNSESEGICDPSSSTTYSLTEKPARNRRQRDCKETATSLRPTMLQMTL